MKRQWRASRIFLGLLLLATSCLAMLFWPREPRWETLPQEILGFDLARGRLITTSPSESQGYNVNSVDLSSGQSTCLISLGLSIDSTLNRYERGRRRWILSPDRTYLAVTDDACNNIVIYSLTSGQLLHEISKGKQFAGDLVTIGFSDDSVLFAIRAEDTVFIWDLRNKAQVKTLAIEQLDFFRRRRDSYCSELLRISSDHQYLAINVSFHESHVYDLTIKKLIGQSEIAGEPWFLPNSNSVMFFHQNGWRDETKLRWYGIEQGLKRMPVSLEAIPSQERFVCFANGCFITAETEEEFAYLMNWLYTPWRSKVEEWLRGKNSKPRCSTRLRVRDISTGEIKSCSFFSSKWKDVSSIWTPLNVVVSEDAQLLAINEYDRLSLWDIPVRRPLASWLICSTLVVLSLWLFWPRVRAESFLSQLPAPAIGLGGGTGKQTPAN